MDDVKAVIPQAIDAMGTPPANPRRGEDDLGRAVGQDSTLLTRDIAR
jgi:hypothetical protein